MDFTMSGFQEDTRNLARNYMKSEQVQTWIQEAKRTKEYPHEFMRDVAKLGFLGMNIDETYGGMGMSPIDALIALEEFAYASISFSLNILVQNSLAGFAIHEFGTNEQKKKYLPDMVRGELFGCFANSEPGVGSDAKNIITTARDHNGTWVMNGEKHFCTTASEAGVAVVFARTSARQAGHPGITAFLVELKNTKGIEVYRQPKNAQAGSQLCRIIFDNAEIGETAILGHREKGWSVCDRTFLNSRLWIAIQGVGAARRALDEILDYTVNQREAFNKPIFDHQYVSFELAKIDISIHAARLLTLEAADQEKIDPHHIEFPAMASRAKYAGTETAEKAALLYYRFSGGLSITEEWAAAQHLLDSLILPIYEGPNEIQLQIIANNLKRRALR